MPTKREQRTDNRKKPVSYITVHRRDLLSYPHGRVVKLQGKNVKVLTHVGTDSFSMIRVYYRILE